MKLIYIEYEFELEGDTTVYQTYVMDTGFGIIELGSIEDEKRIWQEANFLNGWDLEQYVSYYNNYVAVEVL